jgi:glycosyltransferase involved in cell wall biosynthesis
MAYLHQVRVVAHWDKNRTDWLLGTTIHAPRTPSVYSVDGVPVSLLGISTRDQLRMLPCVLAYYLFKEKSIHTISNIIENRLDPFGAGVDLVQNSRIGREGLSYASLKLARRLDVPFVFVPYHHPRWKGWNYRQYIELYRRADAVIALTESERDSLVDFGVQDAKIHVTGMGPILADEWDGKRFRTRYHIAEDQPMVLFLGQKYKYKGLAAILRAAELVWKTFPHTSFVFVGPRTRFSRRLFAGIEDQRVIEINSVTLQEKTDALAACDLLCVPSTQESFGGVYTEAWMMGKPVIGGDIPAIREVISDAIDGYCVPQDAQQIATKIDLLLGAQEIREHLGRHGREKVLENYTWDKLSQKTEDIYKHITTH